MVSRLHALVISARYANAMRRGIVSVAAVAGIAILAFACGGGSAPAVPTASPSAYAQLTMVPFADQTLTSQATTTPPSNSPATTTGTPPSLEISPNAGPVGTLVTVSGSGFSKYTYLYFYCLGKPTTVGRAGGPAGFATIKADAGASFELTWPIPQLLEPQQGRGGGSTPTDGSCFFAVKPPQAQVAFTMTP